MQRTKKFIAGLVIGLLLGLWFGVNIGKNRPIYSNPFRDVSVTEIAKEKGKEVMEEGKKALREQLDESK
ncbi:MAG TPA: hypothetical protein VIM41_09305 [Gammaproteobacteria bacterium]